MAAAKQASATRAGARAEIMDSELAALFSNLDDAREKARDIAAMVKLLVCLDDQSPLSAEDVQRAAMMLDALNNQVLEAVTEGAERCIRLRSATDIPKEPALTRAVN